MKHVTISVICLLILTTLTPAVSNRHSASAARTLKIGIRPSSPPLCFLEVDPNGTRLRGLTIDIIEQVGKLMKQHITYVDTQNYLDRWEMLKNDEIDAVLFTGFGDNDPYLKYISIGVSLKRRIYVHQSCKTVVCDKDLGDKKVGILAGESWSRYPAMGEAVLVLTELEGLKRLNQGELDAFIAPSELVAGYLIQKHKLTNILQVGMVLDTKPLHIAVKAENSVLCARISEAIAQMERRGIIQTIQEKWYGVAFPGDRWDRYGRAILLAIGIAGLALLTVMLWNYNLKRQIRKVTLNLQISEGRSRALIEFSPDIIFVLNREGDIINANKEARALILGDRCDSNIEPKLFHFAGEGEKGKVQEFISLIFKQGQAAGEFGFHDAHQTATLELSIVATLIAGENPVAGPVACLFARDVTERNRIERELFHADRMFMMGQMAACVAHEINNPLGIVRANLELIHSRGWFAEEAGEFVDSIRRNTERAGKITKNLLHVTKPGHAIMAAVDLRELLDTTLGMIRPQLKNISLECRNVGEPPVVHGDRNLLQQVLVNVFLNAQNAMQNLLRPQLRVTCCTNLEKTMARIKVTDNGMGMETRLLTRIFEPFFTHAKIGGIGLGLYISQRIIERHDGIIFAESEIGKGTQIVIELPLSTQQSQDGIAHETDYSSGR